jgi:hypothetical protein
MNNSGSFLFSYTPELRTFNLAWSIFKPIERWPKRKFEVPAFDQLNFLPIVATCLSEAIDFLFDETKMPIKTHHDYYIVAREKDNRFVLVYFTPQVVWRISDKMSLIYEGFKE